MKTTIDLPDGLMRKVKELARSQGVTMRELMIDGLTHEIDRRTTTIPSPDFIFPTTGGRGLQPGVEAGDLTELAYES